MTEKKELQLHTPENHDANLSLQIEDHNTTHLHESHDQISILKLLYMQALVLFIFMGIYIIVALIIFEIRQRRRRLYKIDNNGHSVVIASTQSNPMSSRGIKNWILAEDSDTLAKKMRLCSIASPICAVVLYTVQLSFEMLHAFTQGIHYCQIKSDLVFLLLTWSTSFISLLLWLRQRSMYAHHCRKQFMNRFRSALNYGAMILIIIDFILVPLVFSISKRVISGSADCHNAEDLYIHHIFITVIIIISFILHIILLYLFIAPLYHHKRSQENGATTEGAGRNSRATRHLKKIIHHAVIVSVWDLMLDVVIFFTNFYFAEKTEWMQALIDDLVIIMGVTVALFTYINWRQRLCPFCTRISSYKGPSITTSKAPRLRATSDVDNGSRQGQVNIITKTNGAIRNVLKNGTVQHS